jgi:hypothetical protein
MNEHGVVCSVESVTECFLFTATHIVNVCVLCMFSILSVGGLDQILHISVWINMCEISLSVGV